MSPNPTVFVRDRRHTGPWTLTIIRPDLTPDVDAALVDLAYARTSHLLWAEHLEAHSAGVICEECGSKPYQLTVAREREWVKKYDNIIAVIHALEDGGTPWTGTGSK